MKRILTYLFIITITLSLFSCSQKEEVKIKEKLSTDEAYEVILENENNPNFILLDVRTKGEFNESYIKGARHQELLSEKAFIDSVKDLKKDNYLLIYCRTQNRSEEALGYLKKAGYKKLSYIEGGITKWAKEGKPLVSKAEGTLKTQIKYENVKHQYKNSETFNMDLNLYNEKMENLYKKEIIIKLENLKDEVIYEEKFKTDKTGYLNFTYNLKNLELGKYLFTFKANEKNYLNLETYFLLEVSNEENSEEVLSYEILKEKGYYDDILNLNQEYKEEFIKGNVLKSLAGFKMLDFNLKEVSIIDKVDLKKNTLMVFGSPTCGACTLSWEYLSKLDLSNYNVFYFVTSISEDELLKTKESVINTLDTRKINLDTANIYFDAVSYLWLKILNFKTTPQILMLDHNLEILNFLTNNETNFKDFESFQESFNLTLNKTFNDEVEVLKDYITITLINDSEVIKKQIKKGSKLLDIIFPKKELHQFLGYKLDNEFIDLNTYIFTSDTTLKAEFLKVAVKESELSHLNSFIIDVRSESEYLKYHLKDSYNLPLENLLEEFKKLNVSKDKVLVLYGLKGLDSILESLRDLGYEAYYLIDFKVEETKLDLTYLDRLNREEFDNYFTYREKELQAFKENYGLNYLNLKFSNYDGEEVYLKDYLYKENKPTIIMLGSTTCASCKKPWEEFLELEKDFEFNFLEVIIYSGNLKENILNEINKKTDFELTYSYKYQVFDSFYTYGKEFLVTETPTFFLLDKYGNLTNMLSSFNNALASANIVGDTRSVKAEINFTSPNRKFSERELNGEFLDLVDKPFLKAFLETNYASFYLKERFYDCYHQSLKISDFLRKNNYDFNNPTLIYVLNSLNKDFKAQIAYLDSLNFNAIDNYNFLIIVDNDSYLQEDLILKPYKEKIMFEDLTYENESKIYNHDESYFLALDSAGNLSNLFLDKSKINFLMAKVKDTLSVLGPNLLTKDSIIKENDLVIRKDDAFKNGFLSHLDSTKDMARYDYLNLNFGRNYEDLLLIDKDNNYVKLSSLVDHKRPTVLCFLSDYQDDYYYNFNPLYDLKDEANIFIIFTPYKKVPYSNEYVLEMLNKASEEFIKKATSPQNYDSFKEKVSLMYPDLKGKLLEEKTLEYIKEVSDYSHLSPYIYGQTNKNITPLLNTNIRGIQLYLDRNLNLINISQTYYTVGGVFKSVLKVIKDYIAIYQ